MIYGVLNMKENCFKRISIQSVPNDDCLPCKSNVLENGSTLSSLSVYWSLVSNLIIFLEGCAKKCREFDPDGPSVFVKDSTGRLGNHMYTYAILVAIRVRELLGLHCNT